MDEHNFEDDIDEYIYQKGRNVKDELRDVNSEFNDFYFANNNVLEEIENQFGPQTNN
jgi:hypothetical protein